MLYLIAAFYSSIVIILIGIIIIFIEINIDIDMINVDIDIVFEVINLLGFLTLTLTPNRYTTIYP